MLATMKEGCAARSPPLSSNRPVKGMGKSGMDIVLGGGRGLWIGRYQRLAHIEVIVPCRMVTRYERDTMETRRTEQISGTVDLV